MIFGVDVGYAAKSHSCWGGALEGISGGGSVESPIPRSQEGGTPQ